MAVTPFNACVLTLQKLKQDIRELRFSSVELFRNCRDRLAKILTATEQAQLQCEALPCKM